MDEDKFNYISLTLPFTCRLEIFERLNNWKSTLIEEKTTIQKLEHRTSELPTLTIPSLNNQFNQKAFFIISTSVWVNLHAPQLISRDNLPDQHLDVKKLVEN